MKMGPTVFYSKWLTLLVYVVFWQSCAQKITVANVGEGWSKNSVNTVKFRKNAITSFSNFQFTAYYNKEGYMVLGKRKLKESHWETVQTSYKGHTKDAHNSISIAVDGEGYLHVSWDHHNSKLRYAVGKTPLSLDLGEEITMTGKQEEKVTYPEFYNMPSGDLLFFYRSGESGRGNMVINAYDVESKKWLQIQSNLIDGENKRSAYWQAAVDKHGTVHLSWVWRETWGVETNHDLCYAKSTDGGKTWKKSTGEHYTLPITLANAELAWKIPQNSNLINQTAMTADANGNPYIASYWNEGGIPQFQLVYKAGSTWKRENTGFRESSFTLGGGGTKSIPISRPDILIDKTFAGILFRDSERGNKVSLAYADLKANKAWQVVDLTETSVGQWEPNYDIAQWHKNKTLYVFLQDVTQIDGEGIADVQSSKVNILEVKKLSKLIK